MTNILYMPVVAMDMIVSTNSDWLDGLEYWDLQTPAQPIDLSGIEFELEVRGSPPAATVVIQASTDNGLVRVYANTWQLVVPADTMALIPVAGPPTSVPYVYDMLGRADGYTRLLVSGSITAVLGITRS